MSRRKDWPWHQIKAAVEAKGETLVSVAEIADVSRSSICHVKRWPNPGLQDFLAETIGVAAPEIWPTRYNNQGLPISRRFWIKHNTVPARRRVQKREAA